MKQKNIILLVSCFLMALNLSADDKKYSMNEIYDVMCIQCHSADGSGDTEKLTPSMVGQSEKEILSSLIDVENNDGNIIMEHNRGEIIKRGMIYSAQDMASYMYKRFTK